MSFSFGRNWLSYSKSALDEAKIALARAAFHSLTRGMEMRNARFLDIGFGQGLALFLAAEAGAEVYGIDVDPVCLNALRATHRFFPSIEIPKVDVASILDDDFVRAQQAMGGFDVVHSWGVLHHTGNMAKAFRNAAALVKPEGFLLISIYNRHWTSPFWRILKYIFNRLPTFLQETILFAFYPIFYLRARSLAESGMPLALRGMDLRHDIRDWLGGYPYEYASPMQVKRSFSELGFRMTYCNPTKGFTGCNEFVFQKE
jgi:2-polyprenyl-6-hydroxyphenyl methylase/3-demethylubiquinone-9 3-methyltransferase